MRDVIEDVIEDEVEGMGLAEARRQVVAALMAIDRAAMAPDPEGRRAWTWMAGLCARRVGEILLDGIEAERVAELAALTRIEIEVSDVG